MFSKYRLYYITIFIAITLFLIIFITLKDKTQEKDEVADYIKSYFNHQLIQKEQSLISIAIALSENGDIKDALLNDDQESAKDILTRTAKNLKNFTMLKDIRIQLITNDKFLFARSWESAFEGFPLWWFRDDMGKEILIKKPKCAIEIGMMLTIRATVAILDKNQNIIGYIETIDLLNNLTNSLRQEGIELIVLMRKRYLKEAYLMRENEQIGNYVVANSNASFQYIKKLKGIDFSKLETKPLKINNIFYILEPMLNSKGRSLGWFLLALPPSTYNKFVSQQFSILKLNTIFNQNLDEAVKFWQVEDKIFKSEDDKNLLQILPKLRYKDRLIYIQKARDRLGNYSKEELINIILKESSHTKKIGEIR
jgi:hypothetical protein